MAENLRRKEFNNYEKINFTEDLEEWTNSNPKTIYSLSSDTLIFKNASVFYPWNIVNDKRGICPFGWHIPKDSEWKLLSNELKPTLFILIVLSSCLLDLIVFIVIICLLLASLKIQSL
jgi:uncharacterized protein (TIGR02145 family)